MTCVNITYKLNGVNQIRITACDITAKYTTP
ncbi:hypothetical protein OESDEN_18069 [Oesophagostomum dentatum]|uniref:Phlebovirus glycoprotein G2 fusion domain-containing protein n=1 Tax=Oesophagostomum dentatum TaxID=61180 RepID=A0A0B1SBE9_OESDE|nr:hypothetical protein OESDEN_18069 [Oesophagostomum dentatum]